MTWRDIVIRHASNTKLTKYIAKVTSGNFVTGVLCTTMSALEMNLKNRKAFANQTTWARFKMSS